MKIKFKHLITQPTKRSVLIRFIGFLGVLGLYVGFLTFKFGLITAGWLGLITWSMVVLATPVADGGFLFALPMRLLTGLRMVYGEMTVWFIAIVVNIITYQLNPAVYEKTKLTAVFKFILDHPWPYWGIIFLSAIGTFLSVHFGDELLDISDFKHRYKYHKHKSKYQLVVSLFLIGLVVIVYKQVTKQLW